MNWIKWLLVAGLCMVTNVFAQNGLDRPTVGDYVHRDVERVLNAWKNGVQSVAEMNASISAARKEFQDSVDSPERHAEAEKKFTELLYAKDIHYALRLLFEGVSDQARKTSKGWDQLFFAPVDGGIPEDGQAAFEAWVTGLRKSMGATGNEMLFTNEANIVGPS